MLLVVRGRLFSGPHGSRRVELAVLVREGGGVDWWIGGSWKMK